MIGSGVGIAGFEIGRSFCGGYLFVGEVFGGDVGLYGLWGSLPELVYCWDYCCYWCWQWKCSYRYPMSFECKMCV